MALHFPPAAVICDLAIADGHLAPAAVRGEDGEPVEMTVLDGPVQSPPPAWTAMSASRATSVDGEPLRLLTELRDERSEARASAVADLLRAAIANGRLSANGGAVSVGVLYCGAMLQLDLTPSAEDPRRLCVARVSGGGREALAAIA